jgi:Zn-finger nucleic acid-binding protein
VALTCPHCSAAMREVHAEATTGYCVLLDQCPACGGIWCDRWELYPLTPAAAQRIDRVDDAALQRPLAAAAADPLACPRCRARMYRFHDPVLPNDARIERCPNCDGMWLNRGELWRFKHRGAAQPPQAATTTPAEVERLATQVSDKPPPTVASLGAAFEPAASPAAPDDVTGELARGAGWLIARALIRLLFHF